MVPLLRLGPRLSARCARRTPLAVPYCAATVAPAHRIHYTYAEYLTLEASSNVKHEYLDGQIYAMAGGTPEHAALAAAVIGLLFPELRRGRCRAYDADLRVRVPSTGLATYPDVTVVCGPLERDAEDGQAVTNPTLIVEVLREAGYTALEAADGPSALKVLQSGVRIDLLITDVGLPGGMNGRQIADAARVSRP